MNPVQAAWVASILVAVEGADAPHKGTFEKTSAEIAAEAFRSPLFDGEEGGTKTAAILVAVYRFESHNDPSAAGDCAKSTKFGTCAPGSTPHSFGLGQVNESNFKWLGIPSAEAYLADVGLQVRTSLRMMHSSFKICRTRPVEDRLAWYAAGRDGCPTADDPVKKSRARMRLGQALYAKNPPPPRQDGPGATAGSSP